METIHLVCGTPLLVGLLVLSLALCGMALLIAFAADSPRLYDTFLPVTLLPACVGAVASLFQMSDGLGLMLGEEAGNSDSGMMLHLAIFPFLVSLVLTAPAYLITAVARFRSAWSASGIKLIKATEKVVETTPEDTFTSDANDYISSLTSRPR